MTVVFAIATGVLPAGLLPLECIRLPGRIWVKGAASTAFVAAGVAAGALDTGYGRWVPISLALVVCRSIGVRVSPSHSASSGTA